MQLSSVEIMTFPPVPLRLFEGKNKAKPPLAGEFMSFQQAWPRVTRGRYAAPRFSRSTFSTPEGEYLNVSAKRVLRKSSVRTQPALTPRPASSPPCCPCAPPLLQPSQAFCSHDGKHWNRVLVGER